MGNYLFIGSTTGMFIFDYASNPDYPQYVSSASHVRSCDPVVAQGDFAYVTTHGGTNCGGNTNVLAIYDIKNIKIPNLIKQYDMSYPLGLGIDNATLFICEGDYGFKVFSAESPRDIDIQLISEYPEIKAYDVIARKDVVIITSSDGVYQYSYKDPSNLKLLSKVYSINH